MISTARGRSLPPRPRRHGRRRPRSRPHRRPRGGPARSARSGARARRPRAPPPRAARQARGRRRRRASSALLRLPRGVRRGGDAGRLTNAASTSLATPSRVSPMPPSASTTAPPVDGGGSRPPPPSRVPARQQVSRRRRRPAHGAGTVNGRGHAGVDQPSEFRRPSTSAAAASSADARMCAPAAHVRRRRRSTLLFGNFKACRPVVRAAKCCYGVTRATGRRRGHCDFLIGDAFAAAGGT